MSLHIIILAAGQGKRMLSNKPKVLHSLAGKPMLEHVVNTATQLKPDGIHVIYGHAGAMLRETLGHLKVQWVMQEQQLGTGHAVMQALPAIPADAHVLVLSGDVPCIQIETLNKFINIYREQSLIRASLGLLVAVLEDPFGLGRIVRNTHGDILSIVEEKDADESERLIKEIYSGICCASSRDFSRWLPNLSQNNAQNEYYLTEIIAIAANEESPIVSSQVVSPIEIKGVNTFEQLHQLERAYQLLRAKPLMLAGVQLADTARIDIRGQLTCGKDVFIDVNAVFEGEVSLGDGCVIEPNCILKNAKIGAGCVIHANSVLENVEIAEHCHIGPFARLRPGTKLGANCKIGNFVETKNVTFGANTKASHLSYLGDALIGQRVNIGAGTITCNYDGANKYQTTIEDGAFIGSDTQLIAPVTVGQNATIGAGSTIRKNVPADELTLTVSTQKTIVGWKRPEKKKDKTS